MRRSWSLLLCLLGACEGAAGGPEVEDPAQGTSPPEDPPVEFDSARRKFPSAAALFEGAIQRTCSPNEGVCHRSRQHPDLSRLSNLLDVVGRPCNVQRDDPGTIANICEPEGDEIELLLGEVRQRANISSVDLLPRGAERAAAAEVRVNIKQPLAHGFPAGAAVTLRRAVARLDPLVLVIPLNVVRRAEQGSHEILLDAAALRAQLLPGSVAERRTLFDFLSPARHMPGDPRQVVLGDPNRDGIHGHDLG